MNFFDHKTLGNHILQLCPKVVKHPVYVCMYVCMYQTTCLKNFFLAVCIHIHFLSLIMRVVNVCSTFFNIKNLRVLSPQYIYTAINTVSFYTRPSPICLFNDYRLSSVRYQMEFYVQF